MMTEQAPNTQPLVERDALHSFRNANPPKGYEDAYVDEAYPMVQREIAEYASFQAAAIASADKDRIVSAMAYERSLRRTIQKQISLGYLLNTCVVGPQPDEQEIQRTAAAYLNTSLERVREYSLDPRIYPEETLERSDFIPTVGVNISQEEFDRLYPAAYTQAAHISKVPVDELSPEDAQTAQTFETLLGDGFDKLKRRMKKLGSRTIEIIGVTFNSGKIDLPSAPSSPRSRNT